jgi:hypothetical protein
MRKYLASLHSRPDHHKKNFALLVSGGFTAFIFLIWVLVNSNVPTENAQVAEGQDEVPTPLASVGYGMKGAFGAIGESIGAMFGGSDEPDPEIENVNGSTANTQMKTRAIEIYGE